MTLKTKVLALAVAAMLATVTGAAFAADETPHPPRQKWSFAGPFGKFDRAQLQRGFKVFQDVCSTCHAMRLLSFRNLAEPGGPEFSEGQAAALAAQWLFKVPEVNDQGEATERPPRVGDNFPLPWPNENAARVRYNAVPPDLSVMAKARGYERGFPLAFLDMFTQYQEHGTDYIAALLQGYGDPPPGVTMTPGLHYNRFFPGHGIAMPPPLPKDRTEYTDGSPQTTEQYSKDVSAFLAWAAEPHMEARKRLGFQVMIVLVVFAGLMYFTKKKVWKEVEAPAEAARVQGPGATTT